MWQKRKLLYHRGLDDHIGTYVTDYIFSAVCFILCGHLIIRTIYERRKMTQEQRDTSSCCRAANWLPWHWPKAKPTAASMSTVGVFLLGLANGMMAFMGGLSHHFVQTVEPYEDVNDVWNWLIVWRTAASFSAFFCFGLLTMTEQLLIQEGVIRIPRIVRAVYYVTMAVACAALFGYNFASLVKDTEDPFSVSTSFIISFGVMFVYGVAAIGVVFRYYCCLYRDSQMTSAVETTYSPVHSVDSNKSEERPYKQKIYSCCKNVVVKCHGNNDDVTSRKWELSLTVTSPWLYILSGAMNYFLKSECSDSDDAFNEFGCPFPNAFNHNSVMHVIQLFALIGFFWAENLAMKRRGRIADNSKIRRFATSSTIYNDVINSCAVTNADVEYAVTNNNKPSGRDDVVCEITPSKVAQGVGDVIIVTSSMSDEDEISEQKISTNLTEETEIEDDRYSLYDNSESNPVTDDFMKESRVP